MSGEPVSHARAFELLPWLVNGSLQPAERDAVEQHVRTCILCRRELKEQQGLQDAIAAQPAVHVSPRSGFDELARELDGGVGTPRRQTRYASARPFAVAAAAGIALLAFLLWLVSLPNLPSEAYTTLTTPPRAASPSIDIVFAAGTTEAEMRALLEEIDGEIVAGPSDIGRYGVRLPGDESDVTGVLERLAADPRVRIALRALDGEPQ